MSRNIEIKARAPDLQSLTKAVATIATDGPIEIRQDDSFFRCDTGRLKLRDFGDGTGELIFYQRPDSVEARESFYLRSLTSTPDALRESLALAYGVTGRVIKQRTLYLVGRTRVHLDRVDGLGEFVELEVVLREDEPPSSGEEEAHALMRQLGIAREHLLACAYVDLLARTEVGPAPRVR